MHIVSVSKCAQRTSISFARTGNGNALISQTQRVQCHKRMKLLTKAKGSAEVKLGHDITSPVLLTKLRIRESSRRLQEAEYE